ncbi:hypothetical protein N5923_08900 [Erwiniaceae bacterium BAC15a-03b]|uniref:Uncharacterized protein n=1 Tax=Winslowiella arboricola TaxID=2978220 RepID=A0A9J6PPR6_9GAMM|nr:hypothetical protein [Winslowiella arboricola]MCU5771721.1 hypothetical protein [Winslowiella arboricola]MCU5777608.1 hypothetical protein [Winslowiella arboricola]
MIKVLCALLFTIPLLASANDSCQNLDSNANIKGVHFSIPKFNQGTFENGVIL